MIDPDEFDEAGVAAVEEITANFETALARIDGQQPAAVDCDVARALFGQSDDATFVSDTDGTLVAVNRVTVELTGRDREVPLSSGLPDVSGDTAAESRSTGLNVASALTRTRQGQSCFTDP